LLFQLSLYSVFCLFHNFVKLKMKSEE
jgi:hypothetical protein